MPEEVDGRSFRGGGGGWQDHGSYMRDKAEKLRERLRIEFSSSIAGKLFQGLSFWQTGRTDGVDVKKLVTENGGQFEQYGFRSVSHIIATNVATSNQQWQKLLGGGVNGRSFHIVTPQWLVDCISQGKRLSEKLYLPEVLRNPSSLKHFFSTKSDPVPTRPTTNRQASLPSASDTVITIQGESHSDNFSIAFTLCEKLAETLGPTIPCESASVTYTEGGNLSVINLDLSKSLFESCLDTLPLNTACKLRLVKGTPKIPVFPVDDGSTGLDAALSRIVDARSDIDDELRNVASSAGPSAVRALVLDAVGMFMTGYRFDEIVKLLRSVERVCPSSSIEKSVLSIFTRFSGGKILRKNSF